MNVEMILPIKWTTLKEVEKEPEKIQAWPGIEPIDLCNDYTQRSIHCNANQGNWRAGHYEFIIKLYSMVEVTWKEFIWNDSSFELFLLKCMKVGMIFAVKRTTNAVENELETWSYITLQFKISVISYISFQVNSTIRYIMCKKVKKVMMKLGYMYMYCTSWG